MREIVRENVRLATFVVEKVTEVGDTTANSAGVNEQKYITTFFVVKSRFVQGMSDP